MRLEVLQAINVAACLLKRVVCMKDLAAQASGIGNITIASSDGDGNFLDITVNLDGGTANNDLTITPSVSLISGGEATTRPFSVLQTFELVTATAFPIPSVIDATPGVVHSSLPTSASNTGRVTSTDLGSSSSGMTCQTCQSISGTREIPLVSTTPASESLVGTGKVPSISTIPTSKGLIRTGVAAKIIATPAPGDVSRTSQASDITTLVSHGRVGTGEALEISTSILGFPIQATNGSWSLSKSGWTVALTSVQKIIHTVHSTHTEVVTRTVDRENLGSTNTYSAPQTELNFKIITLKLTRTSNELAPSVKTSPSSVTRASALYIKPSSFTGVASNLGEQLSISLMILLAFFLFC